LLIWLWKVLYGKTFKAVEETVGISDSSLQRQEEWILENVIFLE
jgi:hypothetical protein